MKEEIRAFLSRQLLIDFDIDLSDDSDLFELGLVDSQSYVSIVRFMEHRFGVRFEPEELLSNLAVSVSDLTALLERKLGSRVGAWR